MGNPSATPNEKSMARRRYLVGLGTLGVSSITGCAGGGDEGDTAATPEPAYDISITLPAEVEVGEEVTMAWAIENTGDATGEGVIRIGAVIAGVDRVLEERNVAIAAGETIDGTIVETASETGDVTVFVEAPDGASASSNLRVVDGTNTAIAAEHIKTAREELNAAVELLLQAIKEDDVNLDDEAFAKNLDTANSALAQADPEADSEQLTVIEDLHQFAEFLSLWADSNRTAEAAFGEHLLTGNDEYWTGRDYYFKDTVTAADFQAAVTPFQDSADTFKDAHDQFKTANQTADDAKSILDGISPAVVNAFESIGYAEASSEIEGQVWITAEFVTFAAGLHQGAGAWIEVSGAFYQFEKEDWDAATTHLDRANNQFDTAGTTLDGFATDELDFVLFFFSELLCELGKGPTAVGHWRDAAHAGVKGDQDAYETNVLAGHEIMTECHEN